MYKSNKTLFLDYRKFAFLQLISLSSKPCAQSRVSERIDIEIQMAARDLVFIWRDGGFTPVKVSAGVVFSYIIARHARGGSVGGTLGTAL